jgi:hypothetical protein
MSSNITRNFLLTKNIVFLYADLTGYEFTSGYRTVLQLNM